MFQLIWKLPGRDLLQIDQYHTLEVTQMTSIDMLSSFHNQKRYRKER